MEEAKRRQRTYFAFIPIADKKKFLSVVVVAEHFQMAKDIVKDAVQTLFKDASPVADDDIINFYDLNYKEDVLFEIIQIGPDGKPVEGLWVAILRNGGAYTIEAGPDRQKVKQDLSMKMVDFQPPVNFTGDLYELVGDEKIVLLQIAFSDDFMKGMILGKLHGAPNTTIH